MVLRRVVMPPSSLASHHKSLFTGQEQSSTSSQILPVPNPVTSYWLSEPHEHANLRSTPALPAQCDIAIIGSGMSGVLTAYHILQESAKSNEEVPKILLLEARQLCSGATARNGGHAKVKTATLAGLKNDEEKNELQAFVLGVIRDLKKVVDDEDLAQECEFELRRSFDIFQDASELAPILEVYDKARKCGETWTRERSFMGKDMAENVTGIKGAVGAFSVPCASFWPYKFVTGLLGRMVQRYGGMLNVQTNTPVTHISSDNILTTPRGKLRAKKVVLATNAWTAGLVKEFEGTITPVKGMACHISPSKPVHPHLNNTYNIHYAPADSKGVDYLNPRPDGGIVVGGGSWLFRQNSSLWKGNFDDSVRFPGAVEKHWTESYMQRSFLGWEDSHASPDCIWVGIQGYTRDGRSWIGRVPSNSSSSSSFPTSATNGINNTKNQQWMLAGFNGGGMAQIPRAARAVAKMVREDMGYEDVKQEFGLLGGCGTEREMGG